MAHIKLNEEEEKAYKKGGDARTAACASVKQLAQEEADKRKESVHLVLANDRIVETVNPVPNLSVVLGDEIKRKDSPDKLPVKKAIEPVQEYSSYASTYKLEPRDVKKDSRDKK